MKTFRNVLEVAFGILVIALLSISLSTLWPDKEYGLSGWIQAVGSILAILAAGQIATLQSKRQFEDAARLQHTDRAHSAFRITRSVIEITENASDLLDKVVEEFGGSGAYVIGIGSGSLTFDKQILNDMRDDLNLIVVYELPSARLISQVIPARAIMREIAREIEVAIANYNTLDALDYKEFFDRLSYAQRRVGIHIRRMKRIANSVERQIEIK